MPLRSINDGTGAFRLAEIDSASFKAHYDREGWCLIRGFYTKDDLAPIHRYINHLIDLKLAECGLKPSPGNETIRSGDYLRVCAVDRAKGGDIYRACRCLLPLHRVATCEKTEHLASVLMNTTFLNSNPLTAIRIDQKQEGKYLFDWHQDYPYVQGSQDGIVVWGGLFDVSEGQGGIKLIPQSHKLGIAPIEVVDPDNSNKNGAHFIRIADSSKFDEMDAVRMDMSAGDALVFSTLLLHKSLPMTEGDVRWTYQIRHGNFSDADAVRRGWPGGSALGEPFQVTHPDYVVQR